MKQYTHLIWDFNGTILDDVTPSFQSANDLLTAHGMQPLSSLEEYRATFGFPIIDYYRRMGFDFSKTPYEVLAPEWMEYYHRNTQKEVIFEGMPMLLQWVSDAGLMQLILSATEASMLKRQCDALGISAYFSELLALDNIHAHSKQELGLAWRSRNPQARALMIGDSEHDAEVADAIGADCILVAYGHRPKEALARAKCLFVADTPHEILNFLKG